MLTTKGSTRNPLEEIRTLNSTLENATSKLSWMGQRSGLWGVKI